MNATRIPAPAFRAERGAYDFILRLEEMESHNPGGEALAASSNRWIVRELLEWFQQLESAINGSPTRDAPAQYLAATHAATVDDAAYHRITIRRGIRFLRSL